MSSTTGKALDGLAHLRQSIRDILTTPIGSRVMRRDYGSRLFELVDRPVNRQTLVEMYAAAAEALARWEPRIVVDRVFLTSAEAGRAIITVQATIVENGEPVTLDGIVI